LLRFLFFCLLALSATTPLASETFLNPRRLPTTGDPASLVVADFNGDGLPDIAYIDSSVPAGIPHVILAQANGTYVPAPAISTSTKLNGNCRALDTNKDNKQDLVCTYSSTFNATLVTLPGNGNGTFGTPILTAMPTSNGNYFYPNIYPPMDLNSDGVPDLMVNDGINNRSLIMLGDGNGGFRYASSVGVANPVMAADINHDGKLDLLLINGPSVMIGHGDGTFDNPRLYSLDFDYDNVCTFADVDKDGQLDAVCGYVATNNGDINGATHLIVLHGNADGSFNKTPVFDKVFGHHDTQYDGEGTFQYPVLVTDLNADGIPDILAFAGNGYSVLLGQAGLDFTYPKHYDAGFYNYSVFAGQLSIDLDKDGQVDIVSPGTNGIYISYGRRDGSFSTASAYEVAETLGHATFADFNGDNIPDVAATGGTAIQMSFGKGDGTFSAFSPLVNGGIDFSTPTSPANAYAAHGDFNGDGKQDLLAIGSSAIYQYDSYLYFGNGDGTFQPIQKVSNTSTMVPQFSKTKVVDVNRDGRDDILSSDVISTVAPTHANIYVNLSNGDGNFRTVTTQMPGEPYNTVFYAQNCPPDLADFDHDGKLDVVFGAYSNAYVLKGRGDGSFDPNPLTLPIPGGGGGTSGVAAADFDGDGNPDFAVLYHGGSSYTNGTVVFVYYGNGDGTFSTPLAYPIAFHSYGLITTSDLNGDGLPDIILRGIGVPYDHWSISIIHAKPGRALDSEVNYIAGIGLQDMASLDVNKDGHPDLLIANNMAGSVTVLLNQTVPTVTGVLTASPEPSFVQQPFTITASLYPPPPPSSTTLNGTVSFSLDGASLGSAPVTSNSATLNISSQAARGTHTLTAVWSGDNNYPSISLNGIHIVNGYPVALSFTSSANPVVFGQGFTIQYSLSNASSVPAAIPQPSGTFSLINNGSDLFPPTTVTNGLSGSALFALGLAPAGQHTLVASYSGDSIHEPASVTIVENIAPVSSTTIAQTSPNPSVYGQPITVSATVTIPTGNSLGRLFPPPAPTVTFTGLPSGPITTLAAYNSSASTSTTTVATATYRANALPGGTFNITASYSGNVNTQPSTSAAVTHIVQPAPTITTLSANPTSAYPNQSLALAANVTGVLAPPTGSIHFFDGTTPLSTVTLVSGAAVLTSQLSVGTHALTAVYSGDASNLTSISSAVTVTILPSDFKLSLDPPSISLVTGHHTTLHLTATATGIFADTVRLSASNLPQWVTVQFKPVDLKLTVGGTATTSVYVDTDAVIGYMSQANPHPSRTPGIPATAAALALILAPITLTRRRRIASLLALTIAAALLSAASGCSGKYPDSTPPGVYILKITATGAQAGLSHTINLPLTVTQ
jgi:FG-GAP repeat.